MQSGLQAFCRGAGIDAEKLPADAQTRLLHLAGQLLREALVGLKDLERSRSEIRNRFRIEIPADPDDPRPSLDTLDGGRVADRAASSSTRRAASMQCNGCARRRGEPRSTRTPCRKRCARRSSSSWIGSTRPSSKRASSAPPAAAKQNRATARSTGSFSPSFYRNLIEMPADHLPHTFVEAFATAYRDLLKKTT